MKVSEIRTQLYLTQEQHEALKRVAGKRSVSMAQVVREAVATYIDQAEGRTLNEDVYHNDPAWTILDFVDSLPPTKTKDLALRHDDYLYGRKGR